MQSSPVDGTQGEKLTAEILLILLVCNCDVLPLTLVMTMNILNKPHVNSCKCSGEYCNCSYI